MTAIEKVTALARQEVGYKEKASNAQLDNKTANAGSGNWTKYAQFFDFLRKSGTNVYNGNKNGFDWCDMFYDWLIFQCFGVQLAPKMLYQPLNGCGAGCPYSAGYYRANKAFYVAPAPGDQIFFGSKGKETHTGLVVSVGGGKVCTIEGNSGNMVAERSYAIDDSKIAGYGRPNWALAGGTTPAPAETCTVKLPVLRRGSAGGHVKTLQHLLNDYNKAGIAIDGDFGGVTELAVRAYQKTRGLGADGVVGAITWAKLLM